MKTASNSLCTFFPRKATYEHFTGYAPSDMAKYSGRMDFGMLIAIFLFNFFGFNPFLHCMDFFPFYLLIIICLASISVFLSARIMSLFCFKFSLPSLQSWLLLSV